jgi:hypothetical protein
MNNLTVFALAVVVSLGTTAVLANNNRSITAPASAQTLLDSDGAFRDGLYLGKLAAESGQPMRPGVGRWSTERDRATFASGYRRGYGLSLASTEP